MISEKGSVFRDKYSLSQKSGIGEFDFISDTWDDFLNFFPNINKENKVFFNKNKNSYF